MNHYICRLLRTGKGHDRAKRWRGRCRAVAAAFCLLKTSLVEAGFIAVALLVDVSRHPPFACARFLAFEVAATLWTRRVSLVLGEFSCVTTMSACPF
jgi:hypothetical protein